MALGNVDTLRVLVSLFLLEQLASYDDNDWSSNIPIVTYRDTEIGAKEAKTSFSELYTLLKERVYGVNEVLDDIISDNDAF